MSSRPTVMIAHVVRLTGALTLNVTDSHSTRSVDVVGAGQTRFVRVRLASPTAPGTSAAAPYDVLARIASVLNAAHSPAAPWVVELDPVGAVRIRWIGTGTASLSMPATIGNLLGFVALTHAAIGASGVLADHAPGAAVVAVCADDSDSDWQWRATALAASETADGRAVVYDGRVRRVERELRLRLLPATLADQTPGERLTPCWPPRGVAHASRWALPSLTAATATPDHNATEFVVGAHAIQSAPCAFALGTLQQVISGTDTQCEIGYVRPNALLNERAAPLSVAGWSARRDLILQLTRTGVEVIA